MLRRLFVCLSQTLNVLTGGRPNEMLSAKLYRLRLPYIGTPAWKRNTACVLCRMLNYVFWEQDHCQSAYRAHVRRLRETMQEDQNFHDRYLKAIQTHKGQGTATP